MTNKTFIWILYFTFLLLHFLLQNNGVELSDSADFIIGEASANGVSIGKRIQNTYFAVFAGIVTVGLFSFLSKKFTQRFTIAQPFRSWINGLSIICLLTQSLAFFQPQLIESSLFLAGLSLIIFLVGSLKKTHANFLSSTTWICIGLIFLTNKLLFDSPLVGAILAIGTVFFLQFKSIQSNISLILITLLIGSPILVFGAVESALILNQRGVFLSNYWFTSGIVLIFFLLATITYLRKKQVEIHTLTYSVLVPMAIIGIGILQTYTPIIDQPLEMFEYANKLNPVMQAELFNEIPVLDNLSSHLVSDFFWEFTYRCLNGYHQDASLLIYADFTFIILILAIYFFMRVVLGNHPGIVIGLFLLPALIFILPAYYAVVLIPFGLFYRYSQSLSTKHLLLFLISIVFVVLWRLDLGISLVGGLILLLPLFVYTLPSTRKQLMKWIIPFGGVFGVLAFLFYWNFPNEFSQMKGYFAANQAHGYALLTYEENQYYFLDYIFLPIFISGILVHSVFQLKHTHNKALVFTIVGLSLFYLFNLQRGMVRHSFIEGNETQILSFAWLIVLLKSYQVFLIDKSKTYTFGVLALTSSVIALFFSIGKLNGTVAFAARTTQLNLKAIPKLEQQKINRVRKNLEFDAQNSPLFAFIQNHLKKDETFIDFSNTPLTYFYTGKNIPSYFNQYLQNTVTDQLQIENIRTLNLNKIPIVIFSQNPESYFDHTDNIPNKVRYHLITDLIYNHYEPLTVIGKYRIWKRKNWKINQKQFAKYPILSEDWNLGLIPYYWKTAKLMHFKNNPNLKVNFASTSKKIKWEKSIEANDFLRFMIRSNCDQEAHLQSADFKLHFKLKKGTHLYHIPLGLSEQLKLRQLKELDCFFEQNVTVHQIRFVCLQPE